MTRNRLLLTVIGIGAVVIAAFLLRHHRIDNYSRTSTLSRNDGSTQEIKNVSTQSTPQTSAESDEATVNWKKAKGMENESTSRVDLEIRAIRACILEYHRLYGKYPEGGGAPVAAALLGKTAGQNAVLSWDQRRINSSGELLDPWSTPYLINVTSQTLELSSPGPNRVYSDSHDTSLDRLLAE